MYSQNVYNNLAYQLPWQQARRFRGQDGPAPVRAQATDGCDQFPAVPAHRGGAAGGVVAAAGRGRPPALSSIFCWRRQWCVSRGVGESKGLPPRIFGTTGGKLERGVQRVRGRRCVRTAWAVDRFNAPSYYLRGAGRALPPGFPPPTTHHVRQGPPEQLLQPGPCFFQQLVVAAAAAAAAAAAVVTVANLPLVPGPPPLLRVLVLALVAPGTERAASGVRRHQPVPRRRLRPRGQQQELLEDGRQRVGVEERGHRLARPARPAAAAAGRRRQEAAVRGPLGHGHERGARVALGCYRFQQALFFVWYSLQI